MVGDDGNVFFFLPTLIGIQIPLRHHRPHLFEFLPCAGKFTFQLAIGLGGANGVALFDLAVARRLLGRFASVLGGELGALHSRLVVRLHVAVDDLCDSVSVTNVVQPCDARFDFVAGVEHLLRLSLFAADVFGKRNVGSAGRFGHRIERELARRIPLCA